MPPSLLNPAPPCYAPSLCQVLPPQVACSREGAANHSGLGPGGLPSNHFWYVDSDPLPPLPPQAHKSAKKKAAEAMKEVAAIATVQRARKTYW